MGVTEPTYTNPVYDRDFPDPFVLQVDGRYYAYGTGLAEGGRAFPMLVSEDLVHWEPRGGALEPLDLPGAELYWAPEVASRDGRFWMYYATGRDANPDHHLRLALADHPLGPWRDAGLNLTPHEVFAIDAHPFRDPADGQWYLFYARDELQPPYAGTGIVVDRLLAMDRLEGHPRPVLRPYAEWHVFELQRAVKGGLDWYTIEGPFVRRVADRYVCFYSGGRYEHPNYGVGYALADHPLGPWADADNREGPKVLHTVPGRVIGPGHNSVVAAPDGVTEYVVYHAWDPACTARTMRIDRLEWDGPIPRCDGPSLEPRAAPPRG
jgi:GH43 family beta-xylosidase